MHASEFARKRARIERRAGNRPAFVRKAMEHLIQEARAVEVRAGRVLLGWRMPDGGVVCVKRRFIDWNAAQVELARVRHYAKNPHVPVRAYACSHCGGVHLTSQARR